MSGNIPPHLLTKVWEVVCTFGGGCFHYEVCFRHYLEMFSGTRDDFEKSIADANSGEQIQIFVFVLPDGDLQIRRRYPSDDNLNEQTDTDDDNLNVIISDDEN